MSEIILTFFHLLVQNHILNLENNFIPWPVIQQPSKHTYNTEQLQDTCPYIECRVMPQDLWPGGSDSTAFESGSSWHLTLVSM
jgi:hypothetical protein